MSANVEKNLAAPRLRPEEVIVDFDAELLQAPFLLRCGAFFIDYILLLAVPVLSLIAGRIFGIDGTKTSITPRGRALHDYLARTVVIYGRRTIRTESNA
ncbi:MAG: hypothetical protein IPJ30_25960 [Acidobacteria bacterium]|nr:hypothetical protein [Acidobacteriota bacterium]